MDIKYRLYPYPVLADFNNSYENSEFMVKASMSIEGFDVMIKVDAALTDAMLVAMIENGSAVLLYHLECSQTGYREIKTTDKFEYSIPISSNKLAGELHLCPFIVANKDLSGYYNPNFNSHYSEPINVSKGWLLAVGKQHNWTVKKDMQDLLKSSSPFRILPNMDESQTQMVVEYETDDRIRIKLRPDDYALYKNMRKDPRLKDILNSSIVIPALIYVLGQLQRSEPDENEANFALLPWYISIKEALSKNFNKDIKEIRNENVFELAQKLLKTPVNSAMENLANVGGGSEIEEDEN